MIPAILTQQTRQGVEDFLRTTFPISTPFFHGMLDRFLASGDSLAGVFRKMETPETPPAVDTTDYVAALNNPDFQRRFFVVEDDLELAAMLSALLEKWQVFLHPSQRRLVERHWNGPVRVLGGAGTGKTVAAMHRAKWLAQQVFTSAHDRLLFTTFPRNLAADIRKNLLSICPEEVMRRIEVVNLDKWVSDFLQRHGYSYDIDYGERTGRLWEQALNSAPSKVQVPVSFYREEWERVIQPQGVSSVEEYMKASRIGRGVQLNRSGRKAVWSVFEEYRLLLNEQRLREGDDAMRDARLLLESKGNQTPYQAIIVDEAQDMGPQAFRLLRQLIPGGDRQDDLFIVGDAHQRIYRHKVVLGQCGINIQGRSRKLKINYRTTEETRRWATNLLEGFSIDDLDAGVDDQKGYKSLLHGVTPTVATFLHLQGGSRFYRSLPTSG
ncbi:MAG: UvrD-helicase domain-containing protein [Candidatus Binatia bacterium]